MFFFGFFNSNGHVEPLKWFIVLEFWRLVEGDIVTRLFRSYNTTNSSKVT
jgi:hypothetical protein